MVYFVYDFHAQRGVLWVLHFEYLKKRISELILTSDLSNVNFVNMPFELRPNAKNTKMCTLGPNLMLVKPVVLVIHNVLRYEVMLADVTGEMAQKLQRRAQCSSEGIKMIVRTLSLTDYLNFAEAPVVGFWKTPDQDARLAKFTSINGKYT